MKNLFTKQLSLVLFSLTIPIETKISIPNIPTKISSFFKRRTEDIIHKEFNNVSQLEIICNHGAVIVETWKQPCVLLELKKRGNQQFIEETELVCRQQNNNLQVTTKVSDTASAGSVRLHVLVPKDLPIKITTLNDTITIKNVSGALELHSNRGTIQVFDGTNTVIAKTIQGNILVQRKKIQPDHALNLHSEHGNITLAVPQDINAELEAHTQHGKIQCDLFVTLYTKTVQLNEATFKNMRHHIHGLIGQPMHNVTPANILLSTGLGIIEIQSYDSKKKKK